MANGKESHGALFAVSGLLCARVEDTVGVGEGIAPTLQRGSVVSLEGPLGAGKTQLVKGVVRAMGCLDEASSPSFALLHEYPGGRLPVYHFDFYRVEDSGELQMAGLDDCLADGVVLIEWGDKFPALLPVGTLRLQFELRPGNERRIVGGYTA